MVLGRPSKAALNKRKSLAHAREIKAKKSSAPSAAPETDNTENQDADSESSEDKVVECTGWSGGVAHCVSSDGGPILIGDSDEEVVEELSGSELEEAVQKNMERSARRTVEQQPAAAAMEEPSATPEAATQSEVKPDMISVITGQRSQKEWDKAESSRSLRYNGRSARSKRHREKKARDKETEDAKLRKR